MQNLRVTYPTIKTVFPTLKVYYVEQQSGDPEAWYQVFCVSSEFLLCADAHGVDKADFDANHKASSIAVGAQGDALLLGSEAQAIPLMAKVTPDGRPITAPISFEEGTFLYVCGAGAHPTNGRGEGPKFSLSRSTTGDAALEWGFNDWVKAVGGCGYSTGGAAGDETCFGLYAPATTLEAVTPGTGSVVLVPTGFDVEGTPLNVVVPYPGGTHNVTHAVPVPASVGEQSFWAWSCPDFGEGVVSPQAGGLWNLYEIAVPLARHAAWIQLLGNRDLSVDTGNVKPMLIPPQWRFTATLRTTGTRDVSLVWEMKTVRMRSTKIW